MEGKFSMIASSLASSYPMNEKQRAIVSHQQGPLLIIAGPGSGKTQSLTLRALNLLLCGHARPDELILCTYTEKAAYEMQDRIIDMAKKTQYSGDLSQLKISTIHGLCNHFISKHLHYTPLNDNYETLNEFAQQLFIFDRLNEICTQQTKAFFQELWGAQWSITKKLQHFFDKIVEELIFDKMKAKFPAIRRYPTESDTLQCYLTHAYNKYQRLLKQTNCVDFAHLQKCVYTLLTSPRTLPIVTKDIRYILVDEYQDTNYIQDQILIRLASATGSNNICVVGDEDQALYRFRGATVRNILEFEKKFPECKKIELIVNYRSHPKIIDFCNQWITSTDWSNSSTDSRTFRTNKTILPVDDRHYDEYQAVFSIMSEDPYGEAEQFAEIVHTLKKQGKIHDYNEVALLLYSVQGEMSDIYREALKTKGIPAFCPRARMLFAQEEIRLLVGCFSDLLEYQAIEQNSVVEGDKLTGYIRDCEVQVLQQYQLFPELEKLVHSIKDEVLYEEEGDQRPEKLLADYFYRLLFTEPFVTFLRDESKLYNLAIFSQLLQTFRSRYNITKQNSFKIVSTNFFNTFLCLLYADGVNQYENSQRPFPEGHVQIMTIHQAKGLEFPVIAVGRLDKRPPKPDRKDKCLQNLYHLGPFEPERHIPAFDIRRLYYVAFSRAKNVLILMASRKPDVHFTHTLQSTPDYFVAKDMLQSIKAPAGEKKHILPKPRYGFTSHIQMYKTCPRQFQFFHEYNFTPVHSGEMFFGLLIHQTLEKIHQTILTGRSTALNDRELRTMFERTFQSLQYTNMQIPDMDKKEEAWQQILNYFYHNYQELNSIQASELSVQVEKDDYILTGKIDLLRRSDGGIEILDFKTRPRPDANSSHMTLYKQQLYLYAYAMQKSMGQLPQRLFLYWTMESNKEDALMEVPCTERQIEEVNVYLDEVAARIRQKKFAIDSMPETGVCRVCDIRYFCKREGLL